MREAMLARSPAATGVPGITDLIDYAYDRATEFGCDVYAQRYGLYEGVVTGSKDGKPVAPLMGNFTGYDGGAGDFQGRPLHVRAVLPGPLRSLPVHAALHHADRHDGLVADQRRRRRGQGLREGERGVLWTHTSFEDEFIIMRNSEGANSRFFEPGRCIPSSKACSSASSAGISTPWRRRRPPAVQARPVSLPSPGALATSLAGTGLIVRGAGSPYGLPAGQRGLVLIGNAGSDMWQALRASPEYADGRPHALDRWTRRVGTDVAAALGGEVVFPFDGPPHQPFLRWAQELEGLRPSPLGMLLHPEFGLWHAYRFALLFERAPHAPTVVTADLCASCADRPCLSACPVGAFDGSAYDVDACAGYLVTTPDAACNARGCGARLACPSEPRFNTSRRTRSFTWPRL